MIYVDSPKEYPWTPLRYKVWSHLWSDSGYVDEEGTLHDDELHAMAAKIGLRRDWYQFKVGPNATAAAKIRRSHYDVTPPKRQLALRYGAMAIEIGDYLVQPPNAAPTPTAPAAEE